jgi:hypothetical protein
MAAVLATSAGLVAAGAPQAPRPIVLRTEPAGDGISITVVGLSDIAVNARYELEAFGGPPGKSNKSIQKGAARLKPGAPVTLITLRIANVKSGAWGATLRVQPLGGSSYEETAGR